MHLFTDNTLLTYSFIEQVFSSERGNYSVLKWGYPYVLGRGDVIGKVKN